MRYILVDEKSGDQFIEEFTTKEEAINFANADWARLTQREKNNRTAFYIIESENPDEEADNHYDGNVIKAYKLNGREYK